MAEASADWVSRRGTGSREEGQVAGSDGFKSVRMNEVMLCVTSIYLERCRIWRRLRWRRLVLFFFHFHRNLARDFLYGLDLCAMTGSRQAM